MHKHQGSHVSKSVRSRNWLQIRPRASGLPEKVGSLNVCRRGEPPGW